jgi:hypothetical protein
LVVPPPPMPFSTTSRGTIEGRGKAGAGAGFGAGGLELSVIAKIVPRTSGTIEADDDDACNESRQHDHETDLEDDPFLRMIRFVPVENVCQIDEHLASGIAERGTTESLIPLRPSGTCLESTGFSFNRRWSANEQMASMRNGSGDECSIVFSADGAYQHQPLTDEIIAALNPDLSLADLEADLQEIGYPAERRPREMPVGVSNRTPPGRAVRCPTFR